MAEKWSPEQLQMIQVRGMGMRQAPVVGGVKNGGTSIQCDANAAISGAYRDAMRLRMAGR